jgi:hypothetical protein
MDADFWGVVVLVEFLVLKIQETRLFMKIATLARTKVH